MRSDAERLSDILDAIKKIGGRITDSVDTFQREEMLQVWVIHHLQVIGEAARGLSPLLGDGHPEAPWPQIIALRNILVHEYFGLNMHQVCDHDPKGPPQLEEPVQYIRSQIAPDSRGDA